MSVPEVTAFDFQVGIWQEVNGTSVHEVKKILRDCVIQENWTGGSLNDAVALKSYDKGTQRWYLSWVSSALIHQPWEGRKDWRFYRVFKNPAATSKERMLGQSLMFGGQ